MFIIRIETSYKYRSISLTSAIRKIIEKIILKYIYIILFLENNILIKYNSGFQPNNSTVNQLLER